MEKAREAQVATPSPKSPRVDRRCLFLISAIIVTTVLLTGFVVVLIIYQTEVKRQVGVEDAGNQRESEMSPEPSELAGFWELDRNWTSPGQNMRAKPVPQLGNVRLVNSAGAIGDNGRVEIKSRNKNRWFTVCSDNWDNGDATVVCRQLGYPTADATPEAVSFGAALDGLLSLQCTGTETVVNDCMFQNIRNSQCSSRQYAGVSCVSSPSSPDTTPPVITCPSNQPEGSSAITTPVGQTTSYSFPPATASDTYDNGNPAPAPTITYNIGAPSQVQSGLTMSTGQFALGTSTVTATATDGSENMSTCTFTVTVVEGAAIVTPWNEAGTYSSQWQSLNTICGRSSFNSRIIGGDSVPDIRVWPWAAYLYRRQGRRRYFTCTAELLSSRWALTAAHCVSSSLEIVVGTSYADSPTTRRIDTNFRHPNYKSNTYDSDLALLKLQDPVSFTESVKPVCPTTGSPNHEKTTYGVVADDGTTRSVTDPLRQPCYVIGWGDTQYPGGSVASVLQEVRSPLIMADDCRTNHGYSSSDITDNMICTSTTWSGSGTGSCYGDSGGPMMCKNPAGYWDVVGITSWGNGGCSHSRYPDVLTRVSRFRDWIQRVIDNNGGP